MYNPNPYPSGYVGKLVQAEKEFRRMLLHCIRKNRNNGSRKLKAQWDSDLTLDQEWLDAAYVNGNHVWQFGQSNK